MRILKVGLHKTEDPYRKIPKAYRAKKLVPGEPVMLEFCDGHKARCVLSQTDNYNCDSCYIKRYADTLGLHFVCPRVNDRGGRLLCDIPGNDYCEFHELSTIMEDI